MRCKDFRRFVVVWLLLCVGWSAWAIPLKTGYSLVRWGPSLLPADLSGYVAAAESGSGTIAVRADGRLDVWGPGGLEVAQTITNAVDVAISNFGWVVLLSNGGVTYWANPAMEADVFKTLPFPNWLTNGIAVGAPDGRGMTVLTADGEVYVGGPVAFPGYEVPVAATNIVKLVTGGFTSIAIRGDGRLIGWGSDVRGSLSQLAPMTNVVQVAVGSFNNFVVLSDGTVMHFGLDAPADSRVPGLSNVVEVATYGAAFRDMAFARLADGSLRTIYGSEPPNWLIAAELYAGGGAPGAWVRMPLLADEQGEWLHGLKQTVPGTSRTLTARFPAKPAGPFIWMHDGEVIVGENGATLMVVEPVGRYEVKVDDEGALLTSPAVEFVSSVPRFVIEPLDYVGESGTNLVLMSTAVSALPVTYSWRIDGEPLATWNARTGAFGTDVPAADQSWLDLGVGRPALSGDYSVIASTQSGSVTSRVATVSIHQGPTQDVRQLEGTSWQYLNQGVFKRELAQTFVPQISGRLERMWLHGCVRLADPEIPTLVAIVNTVAFAPGTEVLGQAIIRHLNCDQGQFVDFLEPEIFLEAGQTYAVFLQNAVEGSWGASDLYDFRISENIYGGGFLWHRDLPNGIWQTLHDLSNQTSFDLFFSTYMRPGIPALRLAGLIQGARVAVGESVELQVIPGPGFQPGPEVELRVNGQRATAVAGAPFRFVWVPQSAGEVTLVAATTVDEVEMVTQPIAVSVVAGRPANDDFAAPLQLTGEALSESFNLVGAGLEAGEIPALATARERTAWWTWTAPRSANLTAVLRGVATDVSLEVFAGGTVDSLVKVSEGSGEARLSVEGGRTYRIRISMSADIATTTGTLLLALNDVEITRPGLGNILGAPGNYVVETARTASVRTLTNIVVIMAGQPVSQQTNVPFSVMVPIPNGYPVISLEVTDENGITTTSKPVSLTVRPANDDYNQAITLTGRQLTISASTVGASKSGSDPYYADNIGAHSIWYSWTAPASGVGWMSAPGVPGMVLMGAYSTSTSGASSGPGTDVGSNALYREGSPAVFNAVAGRTYHLLVDAVETNFSWILNLGPRNDLFERAAPIIRAEHEEYVELEGTLLEHREERLAPPNAQGSWWWTWRAPLSGSMLLRASSTGEPVAARVFSGKDFINLETVASGVTGSVSEMRFEAVEGQDYHLALFDFEPTAGSARLQLLVESVRILDPRPGAVVRMGSPLRIQTEFSAVNETLAEMRFTANGQLIGTATNGVTSFDWQPTIPGNYVLQAMARAASDREFIAGSVRVAVYVGESVPQPRLTSGPSFPGAFVFDAAGTLHLIGAPGTGFGLTRPPRFGIPEQGFWPQQVSRWLDLAPLSPDFTVTNDWLLALGSDGRIYVDGEDPLSLPAGVNGFVALRPGWRAAAAIGDNGQVYLNGSQLVDLPVGHQWVDAAHAGYLYAALDSLGRIVCKHQEAWNGPVVASWIAPLNGATRWVRLAPSRSYVVAIDDKGELYLITISELNGTRDYNLKTVPIVRPSGVNAWRDFSGGEHHFLVLSDDGRLFAWGRNWEGQLGTGFGKGDFYNLTPVIMPLGVTAWVEIAAGAFQSMAIGNDCALYGWGENLQGQLGVPPSTPIFEPLRISNVEGVCGEPVLFSRTPATQLPDGTFKLAFPTLMNRRYVIQYSDLTATWKNAAGLVTGTGGMVEWIDAGPPATDSPPVEQSQRLYRVLFAP
jgi:hypothetical protein